MVARSGGTCYAVPACLNHWRVMDDQYMGLSDLRITCRRGTDHPRLCPARPPRLQRRVAGGPAIDRGLDRRPVAIPALSQPLCRQQLWRGTVEGLEDTLVGIPAHPRLLPVCDRFLPAR